MATNNRIIDAHAMLGVENHLALEGDELLRRMDAHGIEAAVVRPMGAELVIDFVAGNDRLLSTPERIFAWVTVNPWAGARALDELERCRDRGAVGLFLHPARQGFMPTEPIVVPLLEQADQFDWPVMFHTGTYVNADVLAVVELARRYPSVAFVAGFGGFADMWFEMPGAMAEVENLYLDLSMTWSAEIKQVVTGSGAHRVLYGSAEPRNRYPVTLRALDRLDLEGPQRQAILCDNVRRILKLP